MRRGGRVPLQRLILLRSDVWRSAGARPLGYDRVGVWHRFRPSATELGGSLHGERSSVPNVYFAVRRRCCGRSHECSRLGRGGVRDEGGLASDLDQPDLVQAELRWQLAHPSARERPILRLLPPLGTDSSGSLGPGHLKRGILGATVREIQTKISEQKPVRLGTLVCHCEWCLRCRVEAESRPS